MKRLSVLLLAFILTFASVSVALADAAQGQEVVTLGKDLTEQQKNQMIESFGNPKDAVIIEVTNEEEHRYLSGLLSPSVIGSRAISSAHIRTEEKGYGITVETKNITWVTERMYVQALSTAGVEDVAVSVNAPFPVSGTAALTGIIKAFETAGDASISEERKKVANQELVATAKLGEKLGEQQIAELFQRIKEEMAERGKLTDEQWRQVILNVAAQLNITLSEQDINMILDFVRNAQALDINWQQVFDQGMEYAKQVQTWVEQNPEAKSLLIRLWDWFKGMVDQFLASW